MSVHVAVDAHNLARDDRGIGRYARAVLSRAVAQPEFRFTFVVRSIWPRRGPIVQALAGADVRVTNRIPHDADLVWFPWNGTFLETKLPSIATVHDCTPFAFPAATERLRSTEQAPFLKTAATARKILVQSAYTAREVERWLHVRADRTIVTPLAADSVFTAGEPLPLPHELHGKRYVLVVGSHEPRKNTGVFCEAFARAFPSGDTILAFTRAPATIPANAFVVPDVDDARLLALYRGATLVAVPSLSEGFGLPLLEALACGAPALASHTTALPEVGGDAAMWIDDPSDIDAWSGALRHLASDNAARERLRALGPQQAARFSWDRCTAQTLDVFRSIVTNA